MRPVWTALAVLLAGGLAFVVSWVGVFFIGINATVDSECDGPCFSKWDEVGYIAFGIGGLCAVAAGYVTWRLINNRASTRPHDDGDVRKERAGAG